MQDYIYLQDLISFEGFNFDNTYWQQERELLQPQLETLGYTGMVWGDGERDSFGPLTRTCTAFDPEGRYVQFFYG